MEKNPLARVFGRALRELRREDDLSVDKIAAELGLSPYSYRRIEAGTDPLHPKHAWRLHRALGRRINWGRTCQILSAIYSAESAPEETDFVRAIVRELSSSDDALSAALVKAAEPASLLAVHPDPVAPAARLLKEFMTAPRSASSPGSAPSSLAAGLTAEIADDLERVSPIHFDLVADLIHRLAAFSPRITADGLIEWESANSKRFRRVLGVVRSSEPLVAAASANVFDWSYVFHDTFEGLFVLSLESKRAASNAQTAVQKALLRRGSRRSIADDTTRSWLNRKVRLKSIKSLASEFASQLQNMLAGKSPGQSPEQGAHLLPAHSAITYNNAWFYWMKSPRYVLAYRDDATPRGKATTAEVLDWTTTARLGAQLSRLWEHDINSDPSAERT